MGARLCKASAASDRGSLLAFGRRSSPARWVSQRGMRILTRRNESILSAFPSQRDAKRFAGRVGSTSKVDSVPVPPHAVP